MAKLRKEDSDRRLQPQMTNEVMLYCQWVPLQRHREHEPLRHCRLEAVNGHLRGAPYWAVGAPSGLIIVLFLVFCACVLLAV